MKRLKMNLFAIVALAIAAVTMSFKMANNSTLAGEKWFEYTDETGDGNPNNAQNYVLTPSNGANPPSCPTGTDEICAVKAQSVTIGGEEHPNLSTVIDDRERKLQ
ncbi:peptide ABC transporter substrate-binding protein [Elizabethkingia anophelis]|jgi:hypothetical protein|nr:peptide ABC transporter substrate-binding protein [Elizabethkingia anophelis]MDV4069988.1 peptide ABC transporter substrate-binding protein [Elizabethkingia anophelis]